MLSDYRKVSQVYNCSVIGLCDRPADLYLLHIQYHHIKITLTIIMLHWTMFIRVPLSSEWCEIYASIVSIIINYLPGLH